MNRAKRNPFVLHMLLSALTLVALVGAVAAQNGARQQGHASHVKLSPSRAVGLSGPHTFRPANLAEVPAEVTRRHYGYRNGHRIAGDTGVIRQTLLLTKADTTQAFSIVPAPSEDEHPFWTVDGRYILFDSNRNSGTDTTPNGAGVYNIFQMATDGTGVTQILASGSNQIEPVLAGDAATLYFVAGGTISFSNGLTAPTTSGFNLYTLNLNNPGQATALTDLPTSNITFTDVRHPSVSPGGDFIVFAGKRTGDTVYHIYKLVLALAQVSQITFGPSNDYGPSISPDATRAAFSSNATGFSPQRQAKGVQANDDIYTISLDTTVANVPSTRITRFVVGTTASNNRNPDWTSFGIAFASTRVDSKNDGVADSVGTTTDIYFVASPTPEGTGNPATKVQTSTPDTAIDPNDPTYNFDPNHIYNEDNPSFQPGTNPSRVAFESDRTTSAALGRNLDIYAAALFDISAPSLLKYDPGINEVVHVARDSAPTVSVREVGAGEKVRFGVTIVDYQTGVQSVFLQIKCPNSGEKDPLGVERKVFTDGFFVGISDESPAGVPLTGAAFLDMNNVANDVPFEFESQAVDAQPQGTAPTLPRFKSGTLYHDNNWTGNIFWPTGNLYIAGLQDQDAYSGSAHPPDIKQNKPPDNNGGCWLQLYDDGPISQGGHEPEGEVAGDGHYTGTWVTPSGFPSDWLIDVIAYDKAVDPADSTQKSNWKIYDNVWGFTTQPFQVLSNCLYVSDYDTGQKFLTGRFDSSLPAADQFTFQPTESYMTELAPTYQGTSGNNPIFPSTYTTTANPPKTGNLLNFTTTLGPQFSYIDYPGCSPDNSYQNYDIWRIQCRGAVPSAVLNQYAPHYEQQPPTPATNGQPLKTLVAESCVIWHSPYSGDLFVGPGTILDGSTQTQLAAFVAAGGRLFLDGQDVAWGLTLGGSVPNQFLSQTMHVAFTADTFLTSLNSGVLDPANQINLAAGPRGPAPIAWETFYTVFIGDCWHNYPGFPFGQNPDDYPPGQNGPLYLWGLSPTTPHFFSSPNQATPDEISFPVSAAVTGVTPDVAGIDATTTSNTPAIVWYSDPTTHSRTVFSCFGWEAVFPGFEPNPLPPGVTGPTPPDLLLLNKRMEMTHNVLDFLRTGRLAGVVRIVNGSGAASAPLAGAVVSAKDRHLNDVVVATAITAADGSYRVDGLNADGAYDLDATKAGFITQHAVGTEFHGASTGTRDFYTTQAQPGIISGTVTVAGSGAPIGGAIVTATDTSGSAGGATFSATTDPSTGSYSISVPNSVYTVQVTNITQLGYVASVPPSYTNVAVASNQTVSGENFQLKLPPGSISGKVDIADATGKDTGAPLAGAIVTATNTVNGVTVTFTSGTTAANGTYSIPNVDVGTYSVTASRSGYQTSSAQSVSVATGKDTPNVNFALTPIPPGAISGLVATSTGVAISGATVVVVDSTGTQVASVLTGAPMTVTDPTTQKTYTANYSIPNVPAGGNVTVTATDNGYTPKPNPDTQTIVISTGVTAYGINFILDPLFVFDNSLSMVSAPFTYTSGGSPLDIASLLDIPSGDVTDGAFLFIGWNAATQSYVNHPTPPADTFHLGDGYFLQDTNTAVTLSLTNGTGVPAPEDSSGNYQPFNIQLQTGWNMIGMPFTSSVDFTQLQVVVNGVTESVPTAQSGGSPALGAALWTFANGSYQVVYTLDPFRGYWLRAFQPATLVVTPSATVGRGVGVATVKPDPTRAPLAYSGSSSAEWKLDLMASTSPSMNSKATLGVQRAATDQYDRFKMQAPPTSSTRAVALTFDHTDWGSKSSSYGVDVRSTGATTWTFTVRSNVLNTPVTLTWPNIAKTGRHDMLLTDLDSQTSFDLHNRASYVIPANSSPITHHFQLQVSRATRPKLELLDIYATMAGGRATTAAASISYTITAQSDVEVSISQGNHRIRTLTSGSTRAAGPSTVTWDLKNDRGSSVSAGLYTVVIRATDTDGHTAHEQRPLVITR